MLDRQAKNLAPCALANAEPRSNEGYRSLTRRFARAESGNVAIIFGLTVFMVVGLVGGAVDFGRWLNVRDQTQSAVDAAVLAAGRVLQMPDKSVSDAIYAANQTYQLNKSLMTRVDSIVFREADGGTSIVGEGTAQVATPFLTPFGIETLPVHTAAKAVLRVGGESESDLEISVMLDVTGSMSGQKIADLRAAANSLVDIVVWQDQSQYTSKIALVPFSGTVNVGSEYFEAVTGITNSAVYETVTVPIYDYVYPPSCYKNGNLKKSCKDKPEYRVQTGTQEVQTLVRNAISTCVVERLDPNNDSSNSVGGTSYDPSELAPGPNRYVQSWNLVSGSSATNCTPAAKVVPLTSDKTKLHTTIDSFVASGVTAGHLGTVWAWYMLSPEWDGVWTGESAPQPYAKLQEKNDQDNPKLRKFAILMTDGVYNTIGDERYGDTSFEAKRIGEQAVKVCSNMKAKGIKVYTIGFQLPNTQAKNVMKSCATDPTYYYETSSGDALRQAFIDIALKISTLRIAK